MWCLCVHQDYLFSGSSDKTIKVRTRSRIGQGLPLHRENRENGQHIFCQGKHREFGNFVKTQGILFAQVVNSLVLMDFFKA